MPKPSRSEDEVTLRILALYTDNKIPAYIGKQLGISPHSVRQRIARVITEDCLHDPEAESYWKGAR